MGFGELEDKIRKDGELEIAGIKKDAQNEIAEIRKEYKEKAGRKCDEIERDGNQKKFIASRKIKSSAKIKAQAMLASEKNRILDEVFMKARDVILALPAEKKKKIMRKLAGDASTVGGGAVVYVDKKYAGLLEGVGNVKVSSVGDFGLIIESRDGSVRVDNRLEKILGRCKTGAKPKLVKILFDVK